MDVVSHFYRPHLPVPTPLRAAEPIELDVFTTQQRIEARFRLVIQEVLRPGNVTHLTVVAHSQGSVTAIDVLWLEWAANLLAGKVVYLITMGSPFTHLYQYYFPHRYPPLFVGPTRSQLNPLWGSWIQKTVRSWANIYRVDDFIGTHIEGDGAGNFPRNYCVAAGGHTWYWREQGVLHLMLPYLPG